MNIKVRSSSMRKLPKQDRGFHKAEKILNTAEEVFSINGYDNTSTEMIAKKAKISIGSLYQFFPNKKSLLREITTKYINEYEKIFESSANYDTNEAGLKEYLQYLVNSLLTYSEDHKCFRQLFNTSSNSPDLLECGLIFHDSIESKIFDSMKLIFHHLDDDLLAIYLEISMKTTVSLIQLAKSSSPEKRHIIKSEMYRMLESFWLPIFKNQEYINL